jgi:hypothetical protein
MSELVAQLGKNGMSSDSDCDDDGQPVYAARPLSWRNPMIDEYVDELDRVHKSLQTRGARSLKRFRESEAIERKGEEWWENCLLKETDPIVGLREAFYNPDWLAAHKKSNPQWYKYDLKVSAEPFALLEMEMEEIEEDL